MSISPTSRRKHLSIKRLLQKYSPPDKKEVSITDEIEDGEALFRTPRSPSSRNMSVSSNYECLTPRPPSKSQKNSSFYRESANPLSSPRLITTSPTRSESHNSPTRSTSRRRIGLSIDNSKNSNSNNESLIPRSPTKSKMSSSFHETRSPRFLSKNQEISINSKSSTPRSSSRSKMSSSFHFENAHSISSSIHAKHDSFYSNTNNSVSRPQWVMPTTSGKSFIDNNFNNADQKIPVTLKKQQKFDKIERIYGSNKFENNEEAKHFRSFHLPKSSDSESVNISSTEITKNDEESTVKSVTERISKDKLSERKKSKSIKLINPTIEDNIDVINTVRTRRNSKKMDDVQARPTSASSGKNYNLLRNVNRLTKFQKNVGLFLPTVLTPNTKIKGNEPSQCISTAIDEGNDLFQNIMKSLPSRATSKVKSYRKKKKKVSDLTYMKLTESIAFAHHSSCGRSQSPKPKPPSTSPR
jgi:hypothetical protein